MCGIAGFYRPNLDPAEYQKTILGMLAMIAHRGPDGTGYFIDDRCGMGTTRLSIIDIESGAQPQSDLSERFWLCYNGEIYNYKELRAELEAKGCVFRTKSDTEVVLQAWLQWGEASLSKLNGGFAFALYDRVESVLILARDRFGKRPLFFAKHQNGYLFASEMKAFLAFPEFQFEQDPAQINAILAQWTPLPAQSGFVGIHSLPMGEFLRITRDNISQHRYESLQLARPPVVASEQEAIERIQQQLHDSVALRMRSDVDVGVYLSGGLDSAIIALLAGEAAQRQLSTFSVEFEDTQFDESPEQREIAAFLGTRHQAVLISHRDITHSFPDALFHAEVPAFRSAFVPMYLLSKQTRQAGIKVVLSGEGADEAFLGYDIFKETQLRAAWDQLDEENRRQQLAKLYPHLGHYGPQDISAITGLYHQFAEERLPGLFSHELRFQNGRFSTRLMRPIPGQEGPDAAFHALTALVAQEAGYSGLSAVQKAQWLEFKTLLPGYLLSTQGDRMSLAHGVENRCPFLDPNVVALACAVNLRFDNGMEEKRLLRRAFAGRLPANIVAKRKFPYRAPECAAFAEHAPDYLELLRSESELAKLSYLDPKFARALCKKVLANPSAEISTKENQTFIFLLSLALLNRFYVQRAGLRDSSAISTIGTPNATHSPLVRAVDKRSNYLITAA